MMKYWLFLVAVLFGAVAHAAPQQDDLLEPEKAFQLSTRVIDAETVEAHWKIADGYYLYRERFKFEPQDDGVRIKETKIPAGIKKHDEFFGDVQSYRKQVSVTLKLSRSDTSVKPFKLKITSQGCADIGVCYPPQTVLADFKLPASAQEPLLSGSGGKVGAFDALRNLIGPSTSQEFLEPDKAFVLTMVPVDGNAILARIDIAKGYYLYRDKTSFKGTEANTIGAYELPRGKEKIDDYFGKTQVYYDRVEVKLPLSMAKAGAVELAAKYQGCAEKGICYPPITKTMMVDMPPGATVAPVRPPLVSTANSVRPATETNQTFVLAMLAAFGAGLLLTFTPCVLPMVPILSSVIVGTGDRKLSKLEGGLLSYAYVLGTALTYTVAGAVAGVTGDQLQAYFQNPWAIGAFSTILVVLALSMFGFYDLHVPAFIQSFLHHHSHRVHHHSKKLPGGTYVGLLVMGLLSALIIGACVSPVLISALGAAISSKDPWLGAGIMFALAHGQGMILIALGIGAGFLMPKAGHWMNRVKHVFGVLLLGVAIYLLNAVPQVPVLLLWAALLIVVAVYLGATQSLPKDAVGWAYLWKGLGTFLLLWGILALIGGLVGNRDILRPLPFGGLAGQPVTAGVATTEPLLFQRVTTARDLDARLDAARAAGKPAIVDYYANWCTDCLRMEKTTFSDPRVRQAMGRFALIQVDVTDNSPDSQAAKQRLGVFGPPAMIFFSSAGQERKELRFYGYRAPAQFLALLAKN